MHLAAVHTGMLSELEILVWALNRGLWGPGLRGTCWGLELGKQLPEAGPPLRAPVARARQSPGALSGSPAKGLCPATPLVCTCRPCHPVTSRCQQPQRRRRGWCCAGHTQGLPCSRDSALCAVAWTPALAATWSAQSCTRAQAVLLSAVLPLGSDSNRLWSVPVREPGSSCWQHESVF